MTGKETSMGPVQRHVRITVTGDCGHILGVYSDAIKEKYPFWCDKCQEDKRLGSYPWKLTTELVYYPTATAETRQTEGK